MKVSLINFEHEASTKIQESCNALIFSKPNKILKINASAIVDSVGNVDYVFILLNKYTFNISTILTILSVYKKDVDKVVLFIDTSSLTKEEEYLFDDVIEEITDFMLCVIVDTEEECINSAIEFINANS